jgi:hypothetical protein
MRLLLSSLAILGVAFAQANETKLQLTIPRDVSEAAARRIAGNSDAPAPVLMLSGLETRVNEGLKIEVFVEDPGAEDPRPIVGSTGLMGSHQASANLPVRKMDLPVPLNDSVLKMLAGKHSVELKLRVEARRDVRP